MIKGDKKLVITSMPGKHTLNGPDDPHFDVLQHVPPVMGSMITFNREGAQYNLYISGDTLYYDELKVKYNHLELDI